MASDHFDILEIYARYCDCLRSDHQSSREILNVVSKMLESRGQTGDAIFSDISKLMSCLLFSVDSRQFNCFYDFVFFACRENGQKNISVSRAITAWRLVLTGRFRLLNQWCNFVEEHQRHNISEDTWQQLLAFSRCVNEDLDGYDPKGAWPVLIDDFVEHMYRMSQSNSCSTEDFCCSCGNMETPSITSTFSGLNLLPGSKRKLVEDTYGQCDATPMCYEDSVNSINLSEPKRLKQTNVLTQNGCWVSDFRSNAVSDVIESQADTSRNNSAGCLQTSQTACAVEDCLSKGFEGHLSIDYDRKSRLSYT